MSACRSQSPVSSSRRQQAAGHPGAPTWRWLFDPWDMRPRAKWCLLIPPWKPLPMDVPWTSTRSPACRSRGGGARAGVSVLPEEQPVSCKKSHAAHLSDRPNVAQRQTAPSPAILSTASHVALRPHLEDLLRRELLANLEAVNRHELRRGGLHIQQPCSRNDDMECRADRGRTLNSWRCFIGTTPALAMWPISGLFSLLSFTFW